MLASEFVFLEKAVHLVPYPGAVLDQLEPVSEKAPPLTDLPHRDVTLRYEVGA
jgi:hypothetical protein